MKADSSLATSVIYSPNNSGKRVYPLTRVSVHCVVGQCIASSLGNLFSNPNFEASSNYGIGKDGSIGQYVPEAYRSWCTSSYDNDNRAITIEVASDTYAPYKVTDAAYRALIKLLVDICKRNGKKKLLWFGDKNKSLSYSPRSDELVMTVHRWFANKSCPGDYLYNLHGTIATEVTKQLGGGSGVTPAPAPSKDVAKPTVTFCVRQGGTWQKEGFTGTAGKAITDIAIKVSKGSVKYRIHVKGGSWLPWVTGYNTSDHTNGYAGNGKAIDAVQVYYSTPSDVVYSLGYYKAKYVVSPLKNGFYSYQYDTETGNGQDGYAGSYGKTIDRFQILLSK